MKQSIYRSYDDLPLFLNARMVAEALGIAAASGYELLHREGFPSLRIGSRIVVPKDKFIRWVNEQTGGGC
ncbi:MAG: helix-turn-helix domain-containing protein [Oscillospiraceae bacterium]|nr:helix-turn-helix domain-containing protein [Oscillospiraceae bacterium]